MALCMSSNANDQTIGYEYDAFGNLKKLTYPDNKQVSYSLGASFVPVDAHMQLTYSILYKGYDYVMTQIIGGFNLKNAYDMLKNIKNSFI